MVINYLVTSIFMLRTVLGHGILKNDSEYVMYISHKFLCGVI